MRAVLSMVAVLVCLTSPVFAVPITFFGEDLNTGNPDPITAPFTNAAAAQNSFFSNLTGVGTETFESFANGATGITANFDQAGTATLNGSGVIRSGNDQQGRTAFSGSKYFFTGTGDFSISFSRAAAAFGFYGIDIGDGGGRIVLTLTDIHDLTTTLTVPGTTPSPSGSNLYFGFLDRTNTYKSVRFSNSSDGADEFAFDDFSVVATEQIAAVPETSTWAMMLLGFAGIGFITYRRRVEG